MVTQRILITGANGLLGQHLVEVLARDPAYEVLATGLQAAPRFQSPSVGYAALDVTDAGALEAACGEFAPSAIVHCAAMTQVDRCESEREACWKLNAGAVELLVELCARRAVRLVHVSTDFIFDGKAGPYAEDDPPAPLSFYGRSKLAAEEAVRRSRLPRWAIARTVLVYGAARGLGRSNFVLWVIEQLSQGKSIQVVTDQWRTPTYAPDLAEGLELLLRRGKDGVFHLSGRDNLSVHNFALRVADAFRLDRRLVQPVDSSTFRQPAPRPPRTGFVIGKAERELGYRPRSIDAALADLKRRLGR